MKKIYFSVLAGLTVLGASAQITVGQYEFKTAGNIFVNDSDTIVSGLNAGAAGANQTWDFSTLVADVSRFDEYKLAQWTPSANEFPTSNVALELDQSNYVYFTHNGTGLFFDGFAGAQGTFKLDDSQQRVQFPISYESSFVDTSVISGIINFQFQNFDSLEFKQTAVVNSTIDAFGSITIPMGTYDALRANISTHEIDSVWGYTLGQRVFLEPFSGDTTVYEMEWYSDHADMAGFVLTAAVDTAGNMQSADYKAAGPGVGINEGLEDVSVKVFPNPASDFLTISVDKPELISNVQIFGLDGKLIMIDEIDEALTQVNLNKFAEGVYIYQLTDVDGNALASKKFTVVK